MILLISSREVEAGRRRAGNLLRSCGRGKLQVILLVVASASPFDAGAWGAEGHRLIAELAESRLTDATRAEVNRVLALEPGATLVSISTWADEFRSPATAAWHYVNLPRDSGRHYVANQSCTQGNCVVGAIDRQVDVLASRTAVRSG